MADHVYRGYSCHQHYEVKILDRAEQWGIRHLKRSAHALDYKGLPCLS